MKIKYNAIGSFDISDVELTVSDNATEEDIVRDIVDDLMGRYNLDISFTEMKCS